MLSTLRLARMGDLRSRLSSGTSIVILRNTSLVCLCIVLCHTDFPDQPTDSRVQTSRQEMIADLDEMAKVRWFLLVLPPSIRWDSFGAIAYTWLVH